MKPNKLLILLITILLSSCAQTNKKIDTSNANLFDISKVNFKKNKLYIHDNYKYSFSSSTSIKKFDKWTTNLESRKSEVTISAPKGKYIKYLNPNKPFFITGVSVKQLNTSVASYSENTLDSLSSNPSIFDVITAPINIAQSAALDILSSPTHLLTGYSDRPSATKYLVETSNSDFILKVNPSLSGAEIYNLLGFTSYVKFNITEFQSGRNIGNHEKAPIIIKNINIYGTYDWLNIALDILKTTKNKTEFKEYMHNFLISFDSKYYYDSFFNKVGHASNSALENISEEKAIEIILQNI